MKINYVQLTIYIALLLLTAGATWGATSTRISTLEKKLQDIQTVDNRLVAVETKIDSINKSVSKIDGIAESVVRIETLLNTHLKNDK